MSARKPSLSSRLGATMTGKVPADEVQARLAAAGPVFEQYLAADRLRAELTAAGIGPSTASPAESSQLLCTWNAYVSVSLAQSFLSAEGLEPGEPGFLPRVTHEQALVLLMEVPTWSARAQRAASDPGYDVATEVALPAPLPPWVHAEPCPASHLRAMRAAGDAMLERIEAELGSLERMPSAGPLIIQLRGLATQVHAQLTSAAAMLGHAVGRRAHDSVEQPLRSAVAGCYVLGQLLARPVLVRRLPPGYPFEALASAQPAAGPWAGRPDPGYAPGAAEPYGPGYGPGYGHGHGYGHDDD